MGRFFSIIGADTADLSFPPSTIRTLSIEEESTDSLAHHSDYVYHVAVNAANDIISCGEDHTVAYWDGETLSLLVDRDTYRLRCHSDSTDPADADTSLSKRMVLRLHGEWRHRFSGE